ncbi:TBC1 domain family member 2A isoform X2 [Tachyglossus aculeatus]|uniref:TBC1 domain family member 2A isoform X2 n=1 Tax=Tachyglossus aculeatus TaxID=9261 RepID=UPI0018F52491|nr:TBC1 domain family member 2A isoform X2 [Tachyglossus aculeatus]
MAGQEGEGMEDAPAAISSEREPPTPDHAADRVHGGETDPHRERDPFSCLKELESVAPRKSSKEDKEPPPKQLCGYLNKFGGKGPIKGWKSRWFFYDRKKCHLYYSRTAQDVNPLGSIDLSSAVFDCNVEAEAGTFEIKTPNRIFILKAINRQAMMYWLQQLQIKRWEYCRSQMGIPALSTADAAGLESESQLQITIEAAENEELWCPVKTPTDVVGLGAASLPAPQMSVAFPNISLKHLGTEIQNTVHNICGNKQPAWNDRAIGDEVQELGQKQDEEQRLQEDPVPAGEDAEEGTKPIQKPGLTASFTQKTKKQNSSFPLFAEGLVRDKTSQDKVTFLQQQILMLTEELKSQKGLVKILHKALEAAQQEKRATSMYLTASEDKDRLELLRHKVRLIADLSKRVEALEQDKKELEQTLGLKDEHIQELKEHVRLLMDKNNAKQQVISKLSEKLTKDLVDGLDAGAIPKQCEKIEHLKDDIEAYKTQNQFLNAEIHQVTKIWRNVAEKEKVLLMKCAYLQAQNCQLESKYLAVLRKIQDSLPEEAHEYGEIVKNVIQEALQLDIKEGTVDSLKLNSISEYDNYGFMTVPEYEVEDLKLLAKIQALEIRSNYLLNHETVEKPLQERWNNIGEPMLSTDLKNLIRSGIPVKRRQQIWRWMVNLRVRAIQTPNRYEELLRKCEATENPAFQQIELDLNRTFTNNKHFVSPTSKFIAKLRRVLLAFSWQNPTIGYCQGLNRLAAIALLVLEEEESSFWCLVAIVETIMPADYYSKTLIASQVDQRVLLDFLSEKLPRLMAHLKLHKIDLSLVTFNWFLVVFVDSLVSDILFRVWDAFLYEGAKVIFRYALAIFKYNEEEILRIHDSLEIYQYLQFFTKTICDGRKLMNIAFNDMNPFPMKQLRNRRALHREKLEAELRELESIKAEYVKERARQRSKPLEGCNSEDEEDT